MPPICGYFVLRIFDITTDDATTLVTVVIVRGSACVLIQCHLGAVQLCQRGLTVLGTVFIVSQYCSTFGFELVSPFAVSQFGNARALYLAP